MELGEKLFFGAIGSILVFITVGIIDCAGANVEVKRGLVQQRFFEASSTSSGFTMNPGTGDFSPVIMSSGAKYNLLLKMDGAIELVPTNKISFVTSEPGQEYKFYCRYGRITGDLIGCTR